MRKGLKIGSPLGIDLYIHWTFWLLVGWLGLGALLEAGVGAMVFQLVFLVGIFASVVLHELGHCVAAKLYGIGTRSIVLSPLGGVALLQRMPERPERELVIALAGPLVNVGIAAVLGGVFGLQVWLGWVRLDVEELQGNLVALWLVGNLMLVLFNLLPAFPMDGGRVLRALLGFFTTRARATNVAAAVGKLVALGLVVAGFALGQPMMVVIAVFVWFLGEHERRVVWMVERRRQHEAYMEGLARLRAERERGWGDADEAVKKNYVFRLE